MPKHELVFALKEIALLGGIIGDVEISSRELGDILETSQQTASRRIMELEREGYISRRPGVKKQLIHITERGSELLKAERESFGRIFEMGTKMHFSGRLVSGMGEGKYYLSQSGYADRFKEILGFEPYHGTFNIELTGTELNKLAILRNHEGFLISDFASKDRTFGAVKFFRGEINGEECGVVIPTRGHYREILEVIASGYLRKRLGLGDGDAAGITVFLKPE